MWYSTVIHALKILYINSEICCGMQNKHDDSNSQRVAVTGFIHGDPNSSGLMNTLVGVYSSKTIANSLHGKQGSTSTTGRSPNFYLKCDDFLILQMEGGSWEKDTNLSDAHCTEDVEEDEGAVSIVVTHQVAVTEALQPRDGHEWKLGHNTSIKTRGEV